MLKVEKKRNFDINKPCLGEIITGNNKNKRVYYVEENDDEKNEIQLDEKFNAKQIRKMKKNMSMDDIKILEQCLKGEIRCPQNLKNIYNLLLDERKNISNTKLILKGQFFCFPDLDVDLKKPFKKSNHIYVAGATGSGKSYWVAEYLKMVNKYQPKREIFIFSDVAYDEAFEKIKNTTRISLDETLLTDPIHPEELKDSVCLFDDIDSIQHKKLKDVVYTLMNSIYRRGRHENITCISTTHNITDYTKSRTAINESSLIVLFCKSGSVNGQKYIMKKYCGFDNDVIKDILKVKSRSVQIHKSYPQYYAWKNGVKLIK